MHASISAHIAADFLLDEVKGIWGPSQAQYQARLAGPEAEERVGNLYFTYLFVLRAVLKAGPVLARGQYRTGDVGQDAATAGLIQRLVGGTPAVDALLGGADCWAHLSDNPALNVRATADLRALQGCHAGDRHHCSKAWQPSSWHSALAPTACHAVHG